MLPAKRAFIHNVIDDSQRVSDEVRLSRAAADLHEVRRHDQHIVDVDVTEVCVFVREDVVAVG